MNLSPGADAFFSLDGGASAIAAFAAGTLNGDGSQAGHWRGGSGIMDAVLDVNTAYQTAANDLRTRRDRLRSPRRPRTNNAGAADLCSGWPKFGARHRPAIGYK